jgi:hypothetical protein
MENGSGPNAVETTTDYTESNLPVDGSTRTLATEDGDTTVVKELQWAITSAQRAKRAWRAMGTCLRMWWSFPYPQSRPHRRCIRDSFAADLPLSSMVLQWHTTQHTIPKWWWSQDRTVEGGSQVIYAHRGNPRLTNPRGFRGHRCRGESDSRMKTPWRHGPTGRGTRGYP